MPALFGERKERLEADPAATQPEESEGYAPDLFFLGFG